MTCGVCERRRFLYVNGAPHELNMKREGSVELRACPACGQKFFSVPLSEWADVVRDQDTQGFQVSCQYRINRGPWQEWQHYEEGSYDWAPSPQAVAQHVKWSLREGGQAKESEQIEVRKVRAVPA